MCKRAGRVRDVIDPGLPHGVRLEGPAVAWWNRGRAAGYRHAERAPDSIEREDRDRGIADRDVQPIHERARIRRPGSAGHTLQTADLEALDRRDVQRKVRAAVDDMSDVVDRDVRRQIR